MNSPVDWLPLAVRRPGTRSEINRQSVWVARPELRAMGVASAIPTPRPSLGLRDVHPNSDGLNKYSKAIVMLHLYNGTICMALLAAAFMPRSSASAESKYDPLAVS